MDMSTKLDVLTYSQTSRWLSENNIVQFLRFDNEDVKRSPGETKKSELKAPNNLLTCVKKRAAGRA